MAAGRTVGLMIMAALAAGLSACAPRVAPQPRYRVEDVNQWRARSSAPEAKVPVTAAPTGNTGPEAASAAPVAADTPAGDAPPADAENASTAPPPDGETAALSPPDASPPADHPAAGEGDDDDPFAKSAAVHEATDGVSPPHPGRPVQRLSLDFRDTDIRNVLRVLAAVSGMNIVVTHEVDKTVTVHLEDIPWTEALDLLLESNGLGKQQKGNVLRVSTLERLQTEREALRAAKDADEKLQVLESTFLKLNYAQAADLAGKLKPVLSKRGVAIPDNRSNTVFIRDVKRVLDDAIDLAREFDTRPVQVLIESNLIETTPTFARALGMELEATAGKSNINSSFAAAQPFSTDVGTTLSIIGAKLGHFKDINSTLSAAEQLGKVRIISRPSVVTLNNVPSTIQSVRVVRASLPTGTTNIATGANAQQAQGVATEQIPIGIALTVTPQVSKDNYILLSIKVKSSSVASPSTPNGIPDELTREAISNVIVHDGETVVIGGILKEMNQKNTAGIPYLKDIPVFGWLFKRIDEAKDLEELMVFITPRIASGGAQDLADADRRWRETMNLNAQPNAWSPAEEGGRPSMGGAP